MDDTVTITRQVELDTTVDELWSLVADGDRWTEWLVDAGSVEVRPGAGGVVVDGGERRDVVVHSVDDGRRVTFEWWTEDERSQVELVLVEAGDRTGLRITETFACAGATARTSTAWDVRLLVLRLGTAALART